MSTSRDRRVEEVYEEQNDQRLDELHSKIRTLRGVTTDIYDDAERQNLVLDDTSNRFTSFGASLAQSSRRAGQAFGIEGGVKPLRIIVYVVSCVFAFWVTYKVLHFWRKSPEQV
ncbi:hypothetical protein PILCRDRAFT_821661 [Piloderma croceum F 1598]|uniref:t-SNARE coiled-coil homology domain-containing protein n=1 Tax=Piloderma croceum (strain F 1598) TaxID=765440 RepID=A0A0C3FNB6_PILCF|nr:hypothetical protein PILCRDRAFT_821661 [Piloderma croceum F 1598]